MKIILFPQVRDRDRIWYEITENKITATINGVSDTFDFTGMPNGELQKWDNEGNEIIETKLDEVPIVSAKKENGELTVEIIFSIDMYEKDERLLFPEPMSVGEFNALMKELAKREKEEEDSGLEEEVLEEVESDGKDGLEK